MNPKNILPFLLGVATAGPLAVGATVYAQVAKSDVREPVNANSLDGFCVYVDKQLVDAGAGGAVTASDLVGMRAEANASLRSFVPDEDPAQCRTSFTLSAAERSAARTFFQDHIRAKLKAACKMP
jgi:hypothetical protein